ncbi:hypothetical protein LU699_12820 [Luteimonas fraxinea]|uniref:hypothetical protein n=1 Tax=Luteimonas fraxinea TaxID=2901869 RepID=UPI001E4D2424|nr:hypothetical protein [Luteimonas fraxinea]UHH09171.1 hypothetical protein LU699_12820 [Luteimonas fraxinea]
MKRSFMCVLIGGALAISACAQGGDTSGASSAQAVQTAPTDIQDKDNSMTALKPPSPDSVLYFVYQRDGDGAHSFQVEGGATVGYWYGHAFDLNGEHYFTGFTSRSVGTDGSEAESTTMEPGHVAIGQVTLVQKDEGGQAGWSQIATDGFVGEFGRLNQPEMVDESRRTVSHKLADGRLILGVPTRMFEDGVAMSNYALFLFNKNGLPQTPFRVWTYVGTVQAGSDNAEACEGGVMTCAASSGELEFEPSSGGDLPRIRIVQSGETVVGPGQTRPLGPEDALSFELDANTERYQAP